MEVYSILMSVYAKENPGYFDMAIRSMLDQTVKTDDFVIVCDGPLTEALDQVLAQHDQENPGLFHIVRLPQNVGIGAAANAGLQVCKNDLVAKMDADDLAVPARCEWQLRLFQEKPDLSLVGGYIEEFDQDPDEPFSVRDVPLTQKGITDYFRRRQPFNNQTVMFRRSMVRKAGGYRDFRRSEDFDLYLRMLHAGAIAENIPEILVKVRVNNAAAMRRASMETLKGCARSRWYAHQLGYASILDVLFCVCGELLIVISPAKVQQFIYQRFLRKGCVNE